ncbi:MAG: sporulation integral membrane protein YtvI [Lawsonibacter sp.]
MRPGQLTWRQRGWLWLRLGIRLLLALVALLLLMRFGQRLLSLFAPFLVALIAAAMLNPLVKWFQRRIGWSRQVVTLLLLLLIFGLLGGALFLLIYAAGNELVSLAQNWNGLLAGLQTALDQLEELFARLWTLVPPQLTDSVQSVTDGLLDWLNTATPNLLDGVLNYTTNKAMGVPSFLMALVIFIMATYFLTADYPYLLTRTVQSIDEGVLRFLGQVRVTALGAFGGYLKAELLLSIGVFFILLAGFLMTRQPYGLLLALGLSIMDFIPIIGAGTVMVPWAVIALITRDYPTAIQMMVIWGVIAMFRRVMEPKFVGDQTGLSPILSLVGIYVGMKLAGVPGMILSPILLLVLLNLSGMGMFRGLRTDLAAAAGDIAAILSGRFDRL